MKLDPVESSNIEAQGYDARDKLLQIKFKSGALHEFAAVPAETYSAFMAAPSKGSYFAKEIRGKFESRKVGA